MSTVSKSFPQESVPAPSIPLSEQDVVGRSALGIWLQIAFAYGLLEAALWTPPGRLDLAWMILTAAFILVMAFRGPYSAREMGVTFPTGKATIWIVGAGLILAATLWSFAALTGADAAPTHAMPLRTTWQYAVWAFLQQFMLQSFFFVRLESLLGSPARGAGYHNFVRCRTYTQSYSDDWKRVGWILLLRNVPALSEYLSVGPSPRDSGTGDGRQRFRCTSASHARGDRIRANPLNASPNAQRMHD